MLISSGVGSIGYAYNIPLNHMWRGFKERQTPCRGVGVGGGMSAGESSVKARGLEIVRDQGGRAHFPKKHKRGRHPKIPCILVPALGWRKLFTLSISHC